MVEVLAEQRAILFAQELGFEKVLIEGDSKTIIEAINVRNMHFASFGHIIQDIKWVNSLLPEVLFYHDKRQENNVAHGLARRARSSVPLLAWMEFVPPNLYDVYHNDLHFSPSGIYIDYYA